LRYDKSQRATAEKSEESSGSDDNDNEDDSSSGSSEEQGDHQTREENSDDKKDEVSEGDGHTDNEERSMDNFVKKCIFLGEKEKIGGGHLV
jgi:hypothetical protein